MDGVSCRYSPQEREKAAKIRDRVLLYARGLDIDPVLALNLALQSMREGGCDQSAGVERYTPHLAGAMSSFRRLLHAQGHSGQVVDPAGRPLRSMPPINRSSMLPEDMNCFSIKRFFKKLGSLFTTPAGRP